MTGVEIPPWFNIDRYTFANAGEKEEREAMLAVLDRLPLYRIAADLPARQEAHQLLHDITPLPPDRATLYRLATTPSIDPTIGDAKVLQTARQALQTWSEHPYRRPDWEIRAALLEALPAAPDNIISVLGNALEEGEDAEREASQRTLHQIVDSVAHLSADEQLQVLEEEVGRLRQLRARGYAGDGDDGERAKLLEPIDRHRVEKLLRYRAAAYMDLTIWGALVGRVPTARDLEQVHDIFCLPGGPDWRTVAKLLGRLRDRDIGFHTRVAEGGIFRGSLRNARRRKGRT